MMELCPCLDAVLWNTGQAEALERLASLGVRSFEFWDWRTRDVDQLAGLCARLELRPVAFSGNTFEEPLVDPAAHPAAFRHLTESLAVASRLSVRTLVGVSQLMSSTPTAPLANFMSPTNRSS